MNAVRRGLGRVAFAAFLAVFSAVSTLAQNGSAGTPPQPPPDEHQVADTVMFLAGGALALGAHESGHLVFDTLFNAQPRLEGVHFGPFPFFAITHRGDMSPRREFTISSAGF